MTPDDEDPWGAQAQRSSGGRAKNTSQQEAFPSPDVLLRRLQSFLRKQSGPQGSGRFFISVLGVLLALWAATGIYKVEPNEQGVVLCFGKAVRLAGAGLNYHLPYPIETVLIKDVTAVNRIDSTVFAGSENGPDEHAMLTGDENLIEVHFTVLWVIKDVEKYLFSAKSPEATVRVAAESVVREIVAQMPMMSVLTQGRGVINHSTKEELQRLMDQYGVGVQIQEVLMGRIDLPRAVIDYYRDVQRAKADQERMVNKALEQKNSKVPIARGAAQQVIQKARGYRKQQVAQAKGAASRFEMIFSEYQKAPDLVRNRMYTETMREILKEKPKMILDGGVLGTGMDGKGGVLPVLSLESLKRTKKPSPALEDGVKSMEGTDAE